MAVRSFLKIDGIDGGSTIARHAGEIDIESFSWGESSALPGGGAGGGSGKVVAQDFHFTMTMSKASPKLMLACAKGEHFPAARLRCEHAGGTNHVFLKVTLKDVLITSYRSAGTGAAEPMDEIALHFGSLEIEYSEQKPDGSLGPSVRDGFDFKVNREF